MTRHAEREFEVTDELILNVLRGNGIRISISDPRVDDAMDLLDLDEIADIATAAGEDWESRTDAASVTVGMRLREAGFFD